MRLLFGIVLLALLTSCYEIKEQKQNIASAETIFRKQGESFYEKEPPKKQKRLPYPWEKGTVANLPKITKNHFRCRGSFSNPPIIKEENNEMKTYSDCEGSSRHSLPLIHGKEGIYPILIEILNYIQLKTKKKVVITCGHRCPIHNSYSDPSREARISKHMIGAEVDFYVQDLEEQPKEILKHIFQFYKDKKRYEGLVSYQNFLRYDKETNVTTPPWYNREIFVKYYKKNEGRDFDNRHPYPYISIQVRYDYELDKSVVYTWERATQGYMRW